MGGALTKQSSRKAAEKEEAKKASSCSSKKEDDEASCSKTEDDEEAQKKPTRQEKDEAKSEEKKTEAEAKEEDGDGMSSTAPVGEDEREIRTPEPHKKQLVAFKSTTGHKSATLISKPKSLSKAPSYGGGLLSGASPLNVFGDGDERAPLREAMSSLADEIEEKQSNQSQKQAAMLMSPKTPKKIRRKNLTENGTNSDQARPRATPDGPHQKVPEHVFHLIAQALTDLFFLGSAMFMSMKTVTTKFLEEQFEAGDTIVKEGDVGDKLYVIISGEVDVLKLKKRPSSAVNSAANSPAVAPKSSHDFSAILSSEEDQSEEKQEQVVTFSADAAAAAAKGVGETPVKAASSSSLDETGEQLCVRTMVEGEVFGELALFYGSRREASVVAKTKVTAWSITHDEFKSMAAVADARSLSLRAVNLGSCPTLAKLTRRQIYAMARAMRTSDFQTPEDEMRLWSKNLPLIDNCMYLIEDGGVVVSAEGMSADQVCAALFPDGIAQQLITVEDDGVHCENGVMLGVPLLHASKNSHANMDLASTILPQLTVVAGPNGCRGHEVSIAALTAHLGPVAGVVFDCDEADVTVASEEDPSSPGKKQLLTPTYIALDDEHEGNAHDVFHGDLSKSDFEVIKILGQGSYGLVVLSKLRNPKKCKAPNALGNPEGHVALKLMGKQRVVAKRQVQHVLDERRLLGKLRHPNIMRLFDAFDDNQALYLVGEYVDGPDLWSVVYEPRVVGYEDGKLRDADDSLLKLYCGCIVAALAHIHDHGIVYRDLKPENVMVASSGFLKIVDFGFAKQLPYYTTSPARRSSGRRGESMIAPAAQHAPTTNLHAHFKTYTLCGTAEYLAPEMIAGGGHDWSVDVWAAGALFFELAVGATPFIEHHGEEDGKIMRRIMQSKHKAFIPPYRLARRKFLSKLVLACLKFDPTERLAADELITHDSFADLDFKLLEAQSNAPAWAPLSRAEIQRQRALDGDGDCDDDDDVSPNLPDFEPFQGNQSIFTAFR